MIVDNIKNIDSYSFSNRNLIEAFEYIKSINFDSINYGRNEINGLELYAFISEYAPKLECEIPWEAHREYIDIQYIIEGQERIGYAKIDDFEVVEKYNSVSDVILGNIEGNFITMKSGDFMVLFPQDVHKPGVVSLKSFIVKKIVVKVKI